MLTDAGMGRAWLHDAHCHVGAYGDGRAVLTRCVAERTPVVWVTTTPADYDQWLAEVGLPAWVRLAPGLHPQELPAQAHQLPRLLECVRGGCRWIGEVGLDGVDRPYESSRSQREVLRAVLDAVAVRPDADEVRLSLHGRRAWSQLLDMLEGGHPSAVLHWFSGDDAALERAIDERRWFSVNPAMAGSRRGRQILQRLPSDRVVLESDGPFVQVEGRLAVPWDGVAVVRTLASLWGNSERKVAEILRSNWRQLDGWVWPV